MNSIKSAAKIMALSVVFFFAAFSTSNAQTIHALIAGATNVSDIGPGCKASIKLMEDALNYVGQQTNMKVKFSHCVGNQFTKNNIENAINRMNPGKNDVVFFYSTSHGFNYNNNPSRFTFIGAHPSKIEMTRSELENFGMSLEKEIFEPLIAKEARLTIAMAEACNTIVDIPAPTRYHAMNVNIQKRLKELFLEAKGAVISTSSRLDQRSWTDPKDGGIYTNMFIESLNNTISSSKEAHWDDVFDNTEQYTQEYAVKEGIRGGQRPETETYFHNTPPPVRVVRNNQEERHDTPVKLIEEDKDTKKRKKKGFYAPKLKVIQEH